jgi:hypothetical protein
MSFLQPLLPLQPASRSRKAPLGTFSAARVSAQSPIGAWIFELRHPPAAPTTLPRGIADTRRSRRSGDHPVLIAP